MTKRYAVIGNPIAHSLSPQMHSAWIADHGLDAVYERVLVEDGAAAFTDYVARSGLDGANVTVPFKEAASALAARGAKPVANVLAREADGAFTAYNTDGDGFLAALEEGAPGWAAARVLILGAGGAAAGVAQALAPGRALTIANRTEARAQALAQSLPGARAAPWSDLSWEFANADLIVQCTTLGMSGAASPAWPVEACKPGAVVTDIVYRPLETPLLRAARARGLRAVDGLGMLIHQGALAFEIWFGIKPDTKKARARLLAILGEGA